MSSIETGYDLAAATYSPDGRLFQVQYAQKAVDNSTTLVALCGKDGVVTAVDRHLSSKLDVEFSKPKVTNVTGHIGVATTGLYPDARALLDMAVDEAKKHLGEFRQPIPIEKLVESVAAHAHGMTLGLSRPFGVAAAFSSWNLEGGPSLFVVEPSGAFFKYRGWSVGKNRQAAKAELEKLKLDELGVEDLVREAARIALIVRDDTKDGMSLEMGLVGAKTGGKHQLVPADVVAAAEEWAREKLDEDDEDEED